MIIHTIARRGRVGLMLDENLSKREGVFNWAYANKELHRLWGAGD